MGNGYEVRRDSRVTFIVGDVRDRARLLQV